MAAPSRQPLNPLAQPFVSPNLKKTELTQDYKNFLANDPQALDKLVDLNVFCLDKITQLESNLTQRLLTDFRRRLDGLEREVLFLRQENSSLKQNIAVIEDSTKSLYLRLEGLPESDTASLPTLVADALSRTGIACFTTDFDMARRIGKSKPNFIRPIQIRFHTQSKRDAILYNRFNINKTPTDSPIWINDEVSDLTRRNRKTAKGVALQANSLGISNVKLHSDGIIIGESKFKLQDLDLLPPLLTAASAKTLHTANDIYFQSELSPFSNFFPSLIQDSDSNLFENVEQAFQFRKALCHNNQQLANKIMSTRDPYEHKRLGNLIDQPTQDWRDKEQDLMATLLCLKFTQNPFLNTFLINTGSKSIHEATGDRKWGIGADLLSNATKNKTWSGNDLLGRLLGDLRTSLITTNSHPTPSPPNPPPISSQVDSLSPMPDDDPQISDPPDDPSMSALDLSAFKTQTTPLSSSTNHQTHSTPHQASLPTEMPTEMISLTDNPPNSTPKVTHPPTPLKTPSPPPNLSFNYPPPPIYNNNSWQVTNRLITQQPISPAPRFQLHKSNKTSASQPVFDI